jgi:ankyrin repeat protein
MHFAKLALSLLAITFAIPAITQKETTMTQEFMNAATRGDVAKVKEMLKTAPTLATTKDERGTSVILKATYYGQKDVVQTLLATGVELNIFEAAATGQAQRVAELTRQDKSLANVFAPDGFMPLGLAVFFGHPGTVEVLLKAGANVNATTRETMKVTPLASAAAARQIGIARVLIANGANVNAQAENDFTPLHEVAARGDLEFATLLLDHGADINARTKDGKSPLAFAQEHKQTVMVEFLRAKGGKL